MAVKRPVINSGPMSKFIAVVLGNTSAALTMYYGTTHWVPIAVEGLTAIAVWLVPNLTVPSPSTDQVPPPLA